MSIFDNESLGNSLIEVAVTSDAFKVEGQSFSSKYVKAVFSMVGEFRGTEDTLEVGSEISKPNISMLLGPSELYEDDNMDMFFSQRNATLEDVLSKRCGDFVNADMASRYELNKAGIDDSVYYETMLEQFGRFVLERADVESSLERFIFSSIAREFTGSIEPYIADNRDRIFDAETCQQARESAYHVNNCVDDETETSMRDLIIKLALVRSQEELREFLTTKGLELGMIDAIVDANRDLYPSMPTATAEEPLS